jgi:hypothetical protein
MGPWCNYVMDARFLQNKFPLNFSGVYLSPIMLFLQLLLSFVLSQNVKQSSTNKLCYLQACVNERGKLLVDVLSMVSYT